MLENTSSFLGEQISSIGTYICGLTELYPDMNEFDMSMEQELFTFGINKDEEIRILEQFENDRKNDTMDCDNFQPYQYASQNGHLDLLNWLHTNNINICSINVSKCDLYSEIIPIDDFIEQL